MAGFKFFRFGSAKQQKNAPAETSNSTVSQAKFVAQPQSNPPPHPQTPTISPIEKILQQGVASEAIKMLEEITEEEVLAAVAYRCKQSAVAAAAATRISRFELILKVLRNCEDKRIGSLLLEKISAEAELRQVAKSARSNFIRRQAEEKLNATATPVSEPEHREAEHSFAANKNLITELENLCGEIEKLWGRHDEAGEQACVELQNRWQDAPKPPPRFMEILDKRFLHACREFQRRAVESKQREQERQNQESAFQQLAQQIEDLAAAPHTNDSWKRIKSDWEKRAASFPPPENARQRYQSAMEKLTAAEQAAAEQLQQQRSTLEQWQTEINAALAATVLRDHTNRMKEIRAQLESNSGASNPALKETFLHCRQGLNTFFAKLKDLYAQEDYERCANLVRKQDLCRQAETLKAETDIPKVATELKHLHELWREAGRVPREEEDALNNRFRALADELHQRCDEHYEQLRRQRAENLARKLELTVAAEAIQDSTDWHQTAEKYKQLQLSWKEIGPGPKDEEPAVYQRFKAASDKFFNNRRIHLDQLKLEWEKNAVGKRQLVEAAAQLLTLDQRAAISRARELRKQWKDAPAADHRTEQELWEQFNTNINRFFAELDAHQQDNINRKEELCRAAAEFAAEMTAAGAGLDFRAASKRAEDLMNNWKASGPVPKEKEVEIWERFEGELKKFYELRRAYYEKLEASRAANTEIKQQLLMQLEAILSAPGNNQEQAEKIKELQKTWKEAGPGAPETEQELWQQFHRLCDDFFSKRNRAYEEFRKEQQENRHRKQELCVRMEKLAGIGAPEGFQRLDNSGLAAELTMAFQSGLSSGMDHHQTQELARTLNEEWHQIGFAGMEESALQQRFARAKKAFFRHDA